jgi:membrane associated rhomboid family serine protease
MKNAAHTVKDELAGILVFLGVIWGAYLLDLVVFPVEFTSFGLVPRTLGGLVGIPLMPLLHAGLGHLLSNTIPLFVLLALLAGSHARSWEIVAEIIVFGGLLLWLFGRSGLIHVGASGLVFGLVAFLIVSGPLEKRFVSLAVALLVAVLYGGTLILGVVPGLNPRVSWDGHLCGAAAGVMIAFARTKAPADKARQKPGGTFGALL